MQYFPTDAKLAELKLPPKSSPQWKHLESLLTLPYFERIWVIQEVHAARKVTFLWGETELSWEDLRWASYYTYQNCFYVKSSVGLREEHFSLSVVGPMILFAPDRPSVQWEDFLRETRGFKASDARDKFFALTGIINDKSAVVVDYTKSIPEVYAQATAAIINSSQTLRILSFACFKPAGRIYDEPNWTPDWITHSDHPLDFFNCDFTSTLTTKAIPRPTPNNWRILSLKGIHLATIASIGPQLSFIPPQTGPNPSWYSHAIPESFHFLETHAAKVTARYPAQTKPNLVPLFTSVLSFGSRLGKGAMPQSAPVGSQIPLLLSLLWGEIIARIAKIGHDPATEDEDLQLRCPRDLVLLAELAIEAFPFENVEGDPLYKRGMIVQFRDWLEGQMDRVHAGMEEQERAVQCAVMCTDLYCSGEVDEAKMLIDTMGFRTFSFSLAALPFKYKR
ncbi:hypothetical protein N0V88_005340 [Collariella sp. IMI 366227]|nr:hypothetical protein N0V88_005340 [Collariella sp. IMI 366227]